jgi:hypothetical protein
MSLLWAGASGHAELVWGGRLSRVLCAEPTRAGFSAVGRETVALGGPYPVERGTRMPTRIDLKELPFFDSLVAAEKAGFLSGMPGPRFVSEGFIWCWCCNDHQLTQLASVGQCKEGKPSGCTWLCGMEDGWHDPQFCKATKAEREQWDADTQGERWLPLG